MANALLKKSHKIDIEKNSHSKEGYEHFMLKEIHEQPLTIKKSARRTPIRRFWHSPFLFIAK